MRIFFTHSYFLFLDPKQWNAGQPYPPLATLYAASLMRNEGNDISMHDTMFDKNTEMVISKIEKQKPDAVVIYDDGFNYLTKMCLTNMREAAFTIIKKAKASGCKVIVSSSDSTDRYEEYLDHGADFILLGEAEQSLLDLSKSLAGGEFSPEDIHGLAFRKNGNTIKTKRREVNRELDNLPFPAWDLLDAEPYRRMWMKSTGYFSLNLATTRGCPFHCNWCAKPIYGNRYNSHSPQYIVDQIKILKSKFNNDHLWFCDDIFGLKPGWVNEFAALMEKENLKIRFKIQSRADLLLKENNIEALARAGCENVWIGAESGSQKILDAMDKGITIEQIGEATRLLKKYAIKPSFFIQFGYPGETRQDIRSTIRMINKLLPESIGISVSYPLPGTLFYENVKAELGAKSNWTDSDELKLMFRNTYAPEFYKQLHRYVQRNHRMRIALHHLVSGLKDPLTIKLKTLRKSAALFYYLPAAWISGVRLSTYKNS
jgi:anaerobic magnesium-protoporphyrin IX monomethyl ester cyclase